MKKASILICCVILLLFENCSRKSQNIKWKYKDANNIVRQTIDSNGNKLEEQKFTIVGNDTLANGVYKKYYSNGNINVVDSYKNDLLTGVSSVFSEDGKLISKNRYYKNKYSGRQFKYYENGKIAQIEYVPLNINKATFGIKYDELGNIMSIGGVSIELHFESYKKIYNASDTVIITNDVVFLNQIKTSLEIVLLKGHLCGIDTIINNFDYDIPTDLHYSTISIPLTKGAYKYIAITTLTDSLSNKIIRQDTTVYKFSAG